MAALIEAASDPTFPAVVVGVISDQREAPGLTIAASRGILTQVIARADFADSRAHDAAIDAALTTLGADIVALAGYMRVLTVPFVEKWLGRLINIHPSLLPSFRGLDTHRRALEVGARIHGCTVHFVTVKVDEGPIIAQAAVPVLAGDSDSRSRHASQGRAPAYPRRLRLVAEGRAHRARARCSTLPAHPTRVVGANRARPRPWRRPGRFGAFYAVGQAA